MLISYCPAPAPAPQLSFWQIEMKQKADIQSRWNGRPCNLEIPILSRVISSLRFLRLNLIQVGAKTNSNHSPAPRPV